MLLSIFVCTARRPIRRGIWMQWGTFVLPCNNHKAAQVADSYSPAFMQESIFVWVWWNDTVGERGRFLANRSRGKSLVNNCCRYPYAELIFKITVSFCAHSI